MIQSLSYASSASDLAKGSLTNLTEDKILEDFSELTREDIKACLAFAASRKRRLLVPTYVKLLLDENVASGP
jgi:hypothetical protein